MSNGVQIVGAFVPALAAVAVARTLLAEFIFACSALLDVLAIVCAVLASELLVVLICASALPKTELLDVLIRVWALARTELLELSEIVCARPWITFVPELVNFRVSGAPLVAVTPVIELT